VESFFLICMTLTATPDVFTLALHDALPIYQTLLFFNAPPDHGDVGFFRGPRLELRGDGGMCLAVERHQHDARCILVETIDHLRLDRKSTRLNSSHVKISYAVVCLKKKKRG